MQCFQNTLAYFVTLLTYNCKMFMKLRPDRKVSVVVVVGGWDAVEHLHVVDEAIVPGTDDRLVLNQKPLTFFWLRGPVLQNITDS
jgi:hypothetical protein